MALRVLLVFVLPFLVSCAVGPSGALPDALWVNNGTTVIVDVIVDGAHARLVSSRSQEEVRGSELPRLPWSIVLRTQSGRVLTLADRTGW